jgi:membrane protease YdiL (CAAX protease family)
VKSNSKNEIKMPWGLWQSLILTVSAFFVSMLVAAIVYISIDGFNLNDTEVNFIVYAFSAFVMLLAAIIFLKFKKVSLKYFFRLPNKKVFFQLPVYYLIYLLIIILLQEIMDFIPGYNPNQEQVLGFESVEGIGILLVFISLVILPPLGEEVLFRGILYPGFRNKLNKVWAALITSALFGLAHMQWNVGVDTFVLSLVIIYALEKHKSLWVAIGLHGIKNFVAFAALFVFNK